MITNIIEWWNNLDPLSEEEQKITNIKLIHTAEDILLKEADEDIFNVLRNEFFTYLPYSNMEKNKYHLYFEDCASTFIRNLFNQYIDDDVLVISSDCEHPTVKEELKKCKNCLILSQYLDIRQLNFDKIKKQIKNYKKIFVYIIATRNDTGEIIPQVFFEKLRELLIKENKDFILILDDVQGMFLVPRDYSIFDYIIGTAHALCPEYDMGILFSKNTFRGKHIYSWGRNYLDRLNIVLKRNNKFNIFKQILTEYFSKYHIYENLSQELSVPYIFYLKIPNIKISENLSAKLGKINLLLPTKNVSKNTFISLRSHWFLIDPTLLPKCIKIVEYLLENKNLDENEIYTIIG